MYIPILCHDYAGHLHYRATDKQLHLIVDYYMLSEVSLNLQDQEDDSASKHEHRHNDDSCVESEPVPTPSVYNRIKIVRTGLAYTKRYR